MENGGQNSISDVHFTYFPVWENCILGSIEESRRRHRRQQSPVLKRAMKKTITMTTLVLSDDVSGVAVTNRTTEMS